MTKRDEVFLQQLREKLTSWLADGGAVTMDGNELILLEDGEPVGKLERNRRSVSDEVHEAVRHLVSELNGRKPN